MSSEYRNPFAAPSKPSRTDRVELAGVLGEPGKRMMRMLSRRTRKMVADNRPDFTEEKGEWNATVDEREQSEIMHKIEQMTEEAQKWIEEEIKDPRRKIDSYLALIDARHVQKLFVAPLLDRVLEIVEANDSSKNHDILRILTDRVGLFDAAHLSRLRPVCEELPETDVTKQIKMNLLLAEARHGISPDPEEAEWLRGWAMKRARTEYLYEAVNVLLAYVRMRHLVGVYESELMEFVKRCVKKARTAEGLGKEIIQTYLDLGMPDQAMEVAHAEISEPTLRARAFMQILDQVPHGVQDCERLLNPTQIQEPTSYAVSTLMELRAEIEIFKKKNGCSSIPDFQQWQELVEHCTGSAAMSLMAYHAILKTEIAYREPLDQTLERCLKNILDHDPDFDRFDEMVCDVYEAGYDLAPLMTKLAKMRISAERRDREARVLESLAKIDLLQGKDPSVHLEAMRAEKPKRYDDQHYDMQWERVVKVQAKMIVTLAEDVLSRV